MEILQFIKEYWVQLMFLGGIAVGVWQVKQASKAATKCSLRNDILQIYQECKDKKEITLYQFEAIMLSYELYTKLKGNSFVQNIVNEIKTYRKI
jgi:hypothetical protein